MSDLLSPNKKQLHFLADLWSQSELGLGEGLTESLTNPNSEMTQCRSFDPM